MTLFLEYTDYYLIDSSGHYLGVMVTELMNSTLRGNLIGSSINWCSVTIGSKYSAEYNIKVQNTVHKRVRKFKMFPQMDSSII